MAECVVVVPAAMDQWVCVFYWQINGNDVDGFVYFRELATCVAQICLKNGRK